MLLVKVKRRVGPLLAELVSQWLKPKRKYVLARPYINVTSSAMNSVITSKNPKCLTFKVTGEGDRPIIIGDMPLINCVSITGSGWIEDDTIRAIQFNHELFIIQGFPEIRVRAFPGEKFVLQIRSYNNVLLSEIPLFRVSK